MAAIDSLLRLLSSQNAEALRLGTGEVPRLTRKGEQVPLSMPPLAPALMETFVGELLSPEQREEVRRQGELSLEHGGFQVTVKPDGVGWVIAARPRPPGPARALAHQAEPPPRRPPPAAAPPAATPAEAAPAAHPVSPADGPAAAQLGRWLGQLLDREGSDLLVSTSEGARVRVGGGLLALPGTPLDGEDLLGLLLPVASEAQRQGFRQHGAADLALDWHGPGGESQRFRVNLFQHRTGLAATFRPVSRQVTSLEELHLPGSLTRLVTYPHGLVLVTGPAGSGKSTTLTALIEHLNRTVEKHIITIEDPIEHEYRPGRCLIHQRELGTHLDSFETGLRAALREAPDIILLGEMRDRATIAAALTAAETGHLVLSTLHAGHAAMAVERIIDIFPEHQQGQVRLQLAQTLRGVLTQYLLPAARSGTRLPVIELLIVNPAVAVMIREGKTHQLQSAIQTGRDDGMISLDRSLADRVSAGELGLEVAMTVTLDGGQQLRELTSRKR